MVDVSGKDATLREARAEACVVFPRGLLARVLRGAGPKGPVEEIARVAGVLAAKRTHELVPLCHPLALDWVEVACVRRAADRLALVCSARCRGSTGVEMEALVGACVAALTVYDMAKALDPRIEIERVRLLEKRGGKRGAWRARGPAPARVARV
jgi:cyclic pyranopterin phosphate synthase